MRRLRQPKNRRAFRARDPEPSPDEVQQKGPMEVPRLDRVPKEVGEIEVVADYAYPLAFGVLADSLGVTPETAARVTAAWPLSFDASPGFFSVSTMFS